MASINTRFIPKDIVTHFDPAPIPADGDILEVRWGKTKDLSGEPSGIFKERRDGPVFVSATGLSGDEHVYPPHGGYERAVMAYNANHYPDWRCEASPHPDLFQNGSFGENLVLTGMDEESVCIGDHYRVGKDVILEVSEPRNPCYKLNKRFQWPMALRRVAVTGRVGWLMRVKQTGHVEKGDKVTLIKRPHPRWSLINVKKTVSGKTVPLELIQELVDLSELTEMVRHFAMKRLLSSRKSYKLAASEYTSARVKHLTFELNEHLTIHRPDFPPYAFAKIEYGPDFSISRSYSIVSGDLNKFCIGVALDDHSRGGSIYIHKNLKIGDEIYMMPGATPAASGVEDEAKADEGVENRVVIVGGIGITAFLPSIQLWEAAGLPYEVHYAVRNPEDASFLERIPPNHLRLYAKSQNMRLDVNSVIPEPSKNGEFNTRIFSCGPKRLMDAIEERATELGYPPRLLHFESFGGDGGGIKGLPFNVKAIDPDTEKVKDLTVKEDKTLLRTLLEAGFDMTFLCEEGACGACKIRLCKGKVQHKGTGIPDKDKANFMLSCVDRGITDIEIALE